MFRIVCNISCILPCTANVASILLLRLVPKMLFFLIEQVQLALKNTSDLLFSFRSIIDRLATLCYYCIDCSVLWLEKVIQSAV